MLAAVAALACRGPAVADALPASGELVCERTALGACSYVDSASGLHFHWPNDWPTRRLKLITETGPAARARHRDAIRWVAIEYVPEDSTQPEASLLRVAVLRSSDWIILASQPGLADEVEVATGRDHVAVATVEPANPYPIGSRDADIFEALILTFAEISRIVSFPAQRASAP